MLRRPIESAGKSGRYGNRTQGFIELTKNFRAALIKQYWVKRDLPPLAIHLSYCNPAAGIRSL
jgi:hypothetical protein